MTYTEKQPNRAIQSPGSRYFNNIPAERIKQALCGRNSSPYWLEDPVSELISVAEAHMDLVQFTKEIETIQDSVYPLHKMFLFLKELIELEQEHQLKS